MGTYTLNRRAGLLLQTAKTLRPIRGGWVNRIGLRNPGIRAVAKRLDRIYSIAGLVDGEWDSLLYCLPAGLPVEINLGCPNVHRYGISPAMLRRYVERHPVIVKLSPTPAVYDVAAMCVEAGVKALHSSNTIPTERGGESGRRLKEINFEIVRNLRNQYPNVQLIAGGGIYAVEDVLDYESAGATVFSLATIWFNPVRALRLIKKCHAVTG